MKTKQALFEILSQSAREWIPLPHVDAVQMREADRIAVEDFRLGILQMMENAGRSLARMAASQLDNLTETRVAVFAGSGGNGGGGLCAARHLHNHGVKISILLTKSEDNLGHPPKVQLNILRRAGLQITPTSQVASAVAQADLILDAMIGYSLHGAPTGITAEWIKLINQSGKPVISLDIPSGLHATTGDTPGAFVQASQTLTLALPKPGLVNPLAGDLFLADIGIPPEVYLPLGITLLPFWGSDDIHPIRRKKLV
ncbi:MAG: NAD(P)H-hydrate epimerase [Anaerolineales bacterium]|nr:NAD(P)H-hydrate epimerase [Anaerolineales bacterium]